MTKITIPINSAKGSSAPLSELVNDVSKFYDEIKKEPISETDFVLDDSNANPLQKLVIDEANILLILAQSGGEIEDYLFGIKQPSSSANLDVPVGVPSRAFILNNINPSPQNIKNFGQWFASNADVWLNSVTNEILYFNQPNPSDSIILKASEAELIRQIDTGTYSFLTVAEVQALILDTNWVKLQ